jgi:hypothetical protein
MKAFRGAWVSTDVESSLFGAYAFAFTDSLSKLDATPSVGYEYTLYRWRGVQQDIPLEKGHFGRVACISVQNQTDKKAQKKEKIQMLKQLTNGSKHRSWAFTTDQLSFIQREVVACLGHPNLENSWWSKNR